ncbi:2-dehydropantoate 2-reductase [soil metagenome]
MRIGVIGAGAIGGTVAALLHTSGHEVEVTARGAHLAAIREGGIRLEGAFGDVTAPVVANEVLTGAADLVILATKAQDASDALAANAAIVSGTRLLVIQNGLDGIANARRETAATDVVGGLAMYAASYLSPGEIRITTPGVTYLSAPVPELAEAMPTTIVRNFVGAQWTKLFVNQVNALPAITGLSVQEVAASQPLLNVLTRSMQENVRIGHARLVRYVNLNGVGDALLSLFELLPSGISSALPAYLARRMGEVPNPGSTLQSIKRGQATEVDYLNGAVVVRAQALGKDAPVNAALVDLVHEVERTGVFLTPAEVLAGVPRPRLRGLSRRD